MMDYHEMAARVLQRRDEYRAEKKRRRRRAVPLLASLCLAVLVGVGVWQTAPGIQDGGGNNATMDGSPRQSGGKDGLPHSYVEDSSGPRGETGVAAEQDPASLPAHAGDVPAQEPYQETRPIPSSLEDLWGGSYWEGGHTVVLLTRDTPETRALVLREHPELDASSVVFQPAAHSLAYLTALQDRISEGMREGKLPFLTTSSLVEAENLIRVTVTTQDGQKLQQLRAFDPTGTALDIQYTDPEREVMYLE